ncbi:hypothetical protein BV898_18964 [Hypsibius exemplaris]|uniref:Uncharacterized protein n=1 Tax=Hypsibius exemplaris TaxID=2072580 RepID=A0A9X6NQZ6_HYPEX|nr:hypothetical protein BV898_18964 [Hypsibius exemplaris]
MLSRICDDAAIFSVRHGVGFTDNLGWSQDGYVGGFSLNQFGNLVRSYRGKTFLLYSFNDIRRLFNGTSTGANLRLRSDCRMCLFKAGACLWTAHAFTYPCPGGKVPLTETKNLPVTGSPIVSVGVGVGCAVIVLLIIGLLMWFYGRRQLQTRRMYKYNKNFANTLALELAGLGGDNDELKAVCSAYVALLNVPMDHLILDDVILGKVQLPRQCGALHSSSSDKPVAIIQRDVPIYQPSQLQQQPQYGQPVNAATADQLAGHAPLQQQPHYGPTVPALAHSQPSTPAQSAETQRAFAEFQSNEHVQFNVEIPGPGQIKKKPITPPKAPRKSLFQMNTAEADKYMSDIMDQVDGERPMNKKKSPITIEEDSSSDEGEALTGNNRVRLATLGPERKFPIRIGAPKKVKRTN